MTRRRLLAFAAGAVGARASRGYRALVCVFLEGGNDSGNLVVPLGQYEAYARARGPVALGASRLVGLAGVPVAGLHPAMPRLAALFAARKVAFVLNTGPLVEPLTKRAIADGAPVPPNLLSHTDQRNAWYTAGESSGWSGRVLDMVGAAQGISPSGDALQLVGGRARPHVVEPGSARGLESLGDPVADRAARSALAGLLGMPGTTVLEGLAAGPFLEALEGGVDPEVAGVARWETRFPVSEIGRQLEQAAQMIRTRDEQGVSGHIFFCRMAGFDTHSGQLGLHERQLAALDEALAAFHSATLEMGVEDRVVMFTESEFGRTLVANGTGGTDHGWGGHQVVLGGGVRGGRLVGTFPNLEPGGPDDITGRGVFIPSIAASQYEATMAAWFGVERADLGRVFPGIEKFKAPVVDLF